MIETSSRLRHIFVHKKMHQQLFGGGGRTR